MSPKKDNLPVNADVSLQNGGTITYANEVIAIIAGAAASEVDGVAGMVNGGGIGDIISKNRNVTRGIRVELGTQETGVDVYTVVEYGRPVHKVAADIQESVRKAIENMTGLHVVKVDVHVMGISFEKEKDVQNLAAGAAERPVLSAAKETAAEEAPAAKPAGEPAAEPAREIAEEIAEAVEEPAEEIAGEIAGEIAEEAAAEPAGELNEEAAVEPAEEITEEAAEEPAEEPAAADAENEEAAEQ